MENDAIKKGAFQIARKIFDSDIWLNKPASWGKIWIYILGKVSHQKNGNCDRGEGFFQWTKEQLGNDITSDMIKKSTAYFRKSGMIGTRRSTRGVYIKVLNYAKYQTLDNYVSIAKRTKKALDKHYDRQECKELKENISNEIAPIKEELRKKYRWMK